MMPALSGVDNVGERTQVAPPSAEISANAVQCAASQELPAIMVPLLRTQGLFFTQPRPPLSPATTSAALLHVTPRSSDVQLYVRQLEMLFPTYAVNEGQQRML
jgi:hypothetical protein